MKQHLLIVGDPGRVPELLRARHGSALSMTSLCLTAEIPQLAGLRFVDRILATGPRDESGDAWTATAVSAHRAAAVTKVAVFDPTAYSRAAAIADVLGVELYPQVAFAAINDHWAVRQRLRAAGGEHVPSGRAPDAAALERFVAEHGLPCLLRFRHADGPAVVLRSVGEVDRVVRAAAGGVAPGDGMLVESLVAGPLFRVAVLVENHGSQALVVLRRSLDHPVQVLPAEPADEEDPQQSQQIRVQAAELAVRLGVRQGMLILDVGVQSSGVQFVSLRLGPPDAQTHQAALRATGLDLAGCCARQACGQPGLDRPLVASPRGGPDPRPSSDKA